LSLKWFAFVILGVFLCRADTVISVTQNANIAEWGVTNTATYGQTITTPGTNTELASFTFNLGPQYIGSGPIHYQAYVYAWDSVTDMATGPALYQSPVSTFTPNGSYQAETFAPDVNLLPGAQYALFFSTSGLQTGQPLSTISWGANNSGAYGGGEFVYLNNGNDSSQWTTSRWDNFGASYDLAFTADFTSPTATPEPRSEALVLGLGLALALVVRSNWPKLRSPRTSV
jgi:hypothetical protein